MGDVGEYIAIPVIVGTVATSVVYLLRSGLEHLRHSRSEKIQADLYTRLLDKFGSSQDLLSYLQTDAGRNLLKPAPGIERSPMPARRIMNSVQIGTVLIFIGAALLLLKPAIVSSDPQEPLTVFGILGLMAGLGFLVSAFASWKLSQSWGLINGRREE